MKYTTSDSSLSEIKADCICLPIFDKAKLSNSGKAIDELCNGELSAQIKNFQIKTEPGSATLLSISAAKFSRILLIGLGDEKKFNATSLRKAAKITSTTILSSNVKQLFVALNDLPTPDDKPFQPAGIFIETIENSRYAFDEYKSKKAPKPSLSQVSFGCTKDQKAYYKDAISFAEALAIGVNKTRDLGNQPGNVCTPTYLANEAKALAKASDDISIKILEEKDMEKLNMGAFLSVSKGSTEPGKMIILNYQGGKKNDAPHVLLGKGITFDTGGISLKPGAQMDEMKYDMCGAASVLGVMTALAEIKPKMNIIGVIASAENMPAGNASKPGDIVTTASGQTVEILNTDAEGRLVLCDALTYIERFKPASVVDIATLTGACIIALGHCTSAVMSNDDKLAEELLSAGKQANDKAWQLPIWDEYQDQLDSPFADMQNIGGKGAGSITAACFLSRFAKEYKWAHLDIAGTAWVSGGKEKGATGRPVPLLLQYLMNKQA